MKTKHISPDAYSEDKYNEELISQIETLIRKELTSRQLTIDLFDVLARGISKLESHIDEKFEHMEKNTKALLKGQSKN